MTRGKKRLSTDPEYQTNWARAIGIPAAFLLAAIAAYYAVGWLASFTVAVAAVLYRLDRHLSPLSLTVYSGYHIAVFLGVSGLLGAVGGFAAWWLYFVFYGQYQHSPPPLPEPFDSQFYDAIETYYYNPDYGKWNEEAKRKNINWNLFQLGIVLGLAGSWWLSWWLGLGIAGCALGTALVFTASFFIYYILKHLEHIETF